MKKILITEDEINLSSLYDLKLTQAGFKTQVARNGIECINKSLNWHPDLILLDLMMPKQDGFETLKILKNNNDTDKIPVIILSNLSQADDVKQILELGAKKHLTKSQTDLDKLIDEINSII